MMKVIALNGSPRKEGNTAYAIKLMAEELRKDGIETEIIEIGHLAIHGCTGCGYCTNSEKNECVFKDDPVNETAAKIRKRQNRYFLSIKREKAYKRQIKAF